MGTNNEYTTEYKYARDVIAGMTRDEAVEATGINFDRLEKIENARLKKIYPDEVVTMAECYRYPELRSYFCSHDCAIGLANDEQEVKEKELSQIAVETLTSLSKLENNKDRLLEIIEDGEISDDELKDFEYIKSTMKKIAQAVDSFQLWLEKAEMKRNA